MNYMRPSLALRLLRWLIILGVLAGIGYAVVSIIQHETRPRMTIELGNSVFRVDIAKTNQALQQGLAGRISLTRGEGMLFVFDNDGDHKMWMKGMKISIDMIWLDEDRKVVHIEHNVEPDAETYEEYGAPKPSRYVLEIAAGQAKQAKITVGSSAKFNVTEGAS